MKKTGTKKKAVKMPRGTWTIKPVTKVKQSKKADVARKICRDKKTTESEIQE